MRGKRRRAVGLAIGSHNMALAEINTGETGALEVVRVEVMDIPDDSTDAGRITNPASMSQAVRQLFANGGMDGVKEIPLAITDDGSITRLQPLPPMSRTETLEALMGEVANYAVLSGGEPALDFQSVNKAGGETTQGTETLFVAAPRALVDSYLSVMEPASLELSSMENQPLAALRALEEIPDQDTDGEQPEYYVDEKPVMLLVIEENVGKIIIVQNKAIQFIHDIAIGGSHIQTERPIRELARELKSSLGYHQRTSPEAGEIQRTILLTDGSNMGNLRERLEELLQMPVVEPAVPTMTERDNEAGTTGYSLSAYAAIGAAIRTIKGKDEESINLLSSLKSSGVVGLRKRLVLSAVLIFLVVFLFVGAKVGISLKADAIEENLLFLNQAQEDSAAQALSDVPIIQADIALLKSQTNITDVAINSIKWANCAKLLQEIREIAPRDLWLVNLRWSENNNIVLGGFGLSYDSVFKFRASLWGSSYFDPVKIVYIRSTEIANREVFRFEIQCGVKKEEMGGEEEQG